MKYNFDKAIERRGTGAVKYDCLYDGSPLPDDALPMWVADMDFACPPAVLKAVEDSCKQQIFGYTDLGLMPDYYRAVADFYRRHYGFYINAESIVVTPGIVSGIQYAVEALSRPGDGIIIQTPVYYPFFSVVEKNQRRVITNPLIEKNGVYTMNFEELEQKASVRTTTMLILCSPHNPVGRVWTKEELTRLHEICHRNNVIIVSDEIHCDLTRTGVKHTVLASLFPNDGNIITCTAPSKTFNIAGLSRSHLICTDPDMRKKLMRFATSLTSPMTAAAVKAAFTECDDWLIELRKYLDGNFEYLSQLLKAKLPRSVMSKPEAMFLAWINVKPYTKNTKQLEKKLLAETGVYIEAGDIFGEEGQGFIRVNIACPRRFIRRFVDALAAQLDRVRRGDMMQEFTLTAAWGQKTTIAADNKKKLLVFLPHVGCRFTQLYLAKLAAAFEKIRESGTKLYVIVQNTTVGVESRLNSRAVPYNILCDTAKEVFGLYRIPSAADKNRFVQTGDLSSLEIIQKSNLREGSPEGDELVLPAAFCINTNNHISHAHYGSTAGDMPEPAALLAEFRREE